MFLDWGAGIIHLQGYFFVLRQNTHNLKSAILKSAVRYTELSAFKMMYIHSHHLVTEVLHHPKGNTVPRKPSIPAAQPPATSNLLSVLICLLQTFHMNGILLSAGALWQASFTEPHVFKVHHVGAGVSLSFLFMAEYYSEVRLYYTFLIHSLDDGIWLVFTVWLSQITLLHSCTSAGLSACSQFSGYTTGRRIAGSCGHAMVNTRSNCHAALPSGCTTFHSHQQHTGVPISPCSHQHQLFSALLFVLNSHAGGCEVVSHRGLDLPFPNHEWCWESFRVLVAICISSLEKYLFGSFAHFSIGLFSCCCYECSLHMLDTWLLSDIRLANTSPHYVSCLFTFLIGSFDASKFLIFMKSMC